MRTEHNECKEMTVVQSEQDVCVAVTHFLCYIFSHVTLVLVHGCISQQFRAGGEAVDSCGSATCW